MDKFSSILIVTQTGQVSNHFSRVRVCETRQADPKDAGRNEIVEPRCIGANRERRILARKTGLDRPHAPDWRTHLR
jgi:hypothetical protein